MCRVMEEMCREENRKGRKEGRLETTRKMLAAGKLALEEIAEYSGLPLDEVKRLHGEMPR